MPSFSGYSTTSFLAIPLIRDTLKPTHSILAICHKINQVLHNVVTCTYSYIVPLVHAFEAIRKVNARFIHALYIAYASLYSGNFKSPIVTFVTYIIAI